MKRSIIFKSLSVAVIAAGVWGCSSKQIAQKSGNEVYDDLYAQVGETSPEVVAINTNRKSTSLNQNPEVSDENRAYNDKFEGTTDYYSEEGGIDARDYQRSTTDRPGYGDYTDGYRDGIADSRYNWGNSWNSGFNTFNRYNYGSMFNNWYNPGVTIILGGRSRFGNFFNPYSNFGYYDPFYAYSPFGYGGFNSFGYGSFYDPFVSSYYSPFGYNNYGYYGGGFLNSPRYYSNNNYYTNNNNSNLGADRATRNYGPRSVGRNSAGYNDQFTNTAKPRTNADPNVRKGTVYSDPSNNAGAYGTGGGYSARTRGGYTGGSNSSNNVNSGTSTQSTNSRGTINSASRDNSGYTTRSRGGVLGSNNQNTNNSGNARPAASDNNTYYAKPSRTYTENGTSRSINNGGNYNNNNTRTSQEPASSNWNSSNSSSSSRGSSFGNSGSSGSNSSSSSGYSGGSSSSSSSGGGGSRSSSGGGSRGPR